MRSVSPNLFCLKKFYRTAIIINTFLDKNAIFDESTGKYEIKELADFDGYLRQNPFNKSNDMAKWLNKAIKKRYNVNTIMGANASQPQKAH